MNIKQRLTRLCAAVVAAVMLVGVAACGGTNNGGGSTASSGDTILFGGDAGSPTFVRNFNPFSTSKRQGINFMYEPLEVINAIDGTLTPFLATGHKIVDAKTVNFTIREGVKWQDGKDLTPADVTFTFDLIKKNAALDTLGVWQHIDSIETSGNDVVFHLKSDDVPGATVIAQQLIVPEHIWKDVKDPVKWTNENPVGSGPYQLDQFTPNQYTLKKNQTYWQKDKVAAEKIVLPASNKQLDLVNKGYDWAYSYMNNVDKTWAGQKDKSSQDRKSVV